jgi:hypothetical protein
MKEQIELLTHNPIVDRVGKMNFTGNIIPETWYYTIVSPSGKVNSNAINILADIVYWYRPTEVREENGNSVKFVKKFKDDDFVQKSYDQLCKKFNLSQKQVRECLKLLESLGVVKRHFRNIRTSMGCCSNVMYIELIPEVLEKLTFPEICPSSDEENMDDPMCQGILPKKETYPSEENNTYTKNFSENITEITPTTTGEADVVDLETIKPVFNGLDMPDKDILAVYNAADKDLDKCKSAIATAQTQTSKIINITGWLIRAVKEGYTTISKQPSANRNGFNSFPQNNYDFVQLEKALLDN